MVVSGVISEATGGKFANGAATAAFAWAATRLRRNGQSGLSLDDYRSEVLDNTDNAGEGTELLGGKVIAMKWGSKSAVLSKGQITNLKTSLREILTNGGEGGALLESALTNSSKPLRIYVNDISENAGVRDGFALTVDLNSEITFFDENSQSAMKMSLTRILTHEMGHAVLGIKDISEPMTVFGQAKYSYPNVRFTDGVMKGIDQTVRGSYCNPYFTGCPQ
jgi:hypothetical protein